MWFGILGPLLVRDGDAAVDVPTVRQRVLLAALLVHAGQVVPASTLAEVVWDGVPPAGAVVTLRSYVMRLRRVLGPEVGSRVVTRYPGYLLEAGEHEVDLLRFTCLCRDGGAAVRAGDWPQAYGLLGDALDLWRGEPLADIPSDLLRRDELPGWEQLQLQALEWRIDAGLHLGCHGELEPELRSLTARYPLRERFHAQLMLALYRSGRQAEALAAYQHARGMLVEELGTEPGTELRELHRQMLTADLALGAPGSSLPAAGGTAPTVPQELPARVGHFTGRTGELQTLTGLVEQAADATPGMVVISAIGGTAGVGKTALAVHWAHQVTNRFPDGQLYVNLRGYDPAQPVPATDALAGFLRALGVAGQDIPLEEAERAARYRSLLAGRRMLVILDNAASEEQVRPLLPGTPACVVVTSRDALAGLVARDGALRLDLDSLPFAEAVGLLRALIGDRVDADPAAAAALAAQCCRLPLALRVAAELAVGRPRVPLAELVGELADQQRRLDLLDAGGDPRTAVRTVFSWSYRHLGADAARAFRLAGLHPGPDFDSYAAAALTHATREQTSRLLNVLVSGHLLQPTDRGRYGLHDLLGAYARELAARDTNETQKMALTRLFDYYLHTAAAAMDALFPAERHRRPRVPPAATPAPPMTDPAAARAWLDDERATLVAIAAHTADCGWPRHATRLAATVFRYLDDGGHNSEALAIHTDACRAARRAGDRSAEAEAVHNLSVVDLRHGRYDQATHRLQRVLTLYREAGDQTGQARALNNLAIIDTRQGRHAQAAGHVRQALDLYRKTGDKSGEARALHNLGTMDAVQGRYQQATDHLQGVLTLYREAGNQAGQARAMNNLGIIDARQGRYQRGRDYHQQALTLFREIGEQSGEAEALNELGENFRASGQPALALTQYTAALALARQIGDQELQARAHDGLGHAYQATGDRDQARHQWQEALTLYIELGAPAADQVRARLTAAGEDSQHEP